jgi:type II secretory pathway pseudopilin PulG
MLVVAALIAFLSALTIPAMRGLVGASGVRGAVGSVLGTLEQALSAAIDSYKLDIGNYPSSNNLYSELTAAGPVNTNKVYFEPTAGMVNTNSTPRTFQDPYGNTYNYEPEEPERNVGLFDLGSSAGTTEDPSDDIWN